MRFFKPDRTLIKSIIQYAGDRIIVDVGCGMDADLILDLLIEGHTKLIGIDIFLDYLNVLRKIRKISDTASVHLFPQEVSQLEHILVKLGDKALFLLCRPCHHPDLIENTIQMAQIGGSEILYIGKEENVDSDLGIFQYKQIELPGTSAENEIILKITNEIS